MRFLSRSQNPKIALFSFVALLTFGVVAGSGCEDKHIGRVCSIGVGQSGGGASTSTTTITSPALECPDRICLRGAATPITDDDPKGTRGLCTAGCSSDDDCDGESTVCKSGFICTWPTTVGPFCCQKMCVCRAFAGTLPANNAKPAVCEPGMSSCVNVH